MKFASLKSSTSGQTLKRSVETRLSSFGYALRPAVPGDLSAYDIVNTRDDRIVWLNSSLDEIADLNDWLLGSLQRRAAH